MSSETISIPAKKEENEFQTGQVVNILGGHFIHDTYTAFVAPLLPTIIEKLSLSLTQAGLLNAIMQIPAVLNPFIGYIADKVSLRYFVILAPALTGTLISFMGFPANFVSLAILFFVIGVSVAAFHAPAPAIVGRISGSRVGFGMSLFMASGELGRTIGPIVAVYIVANFGLEGLARLAVVGWGTSFVLWLRFRNVSGKGDLGKPNRLISELPRIKALFLPLLFVIVPRSFMMGSVTTFMPTFLSGEGSTLVEGGITLATIEIAGVVGALFSGTISDRIGRKRTLMIAFIASALFMFLYLQADGWWEVPLLLLLGFASLSPQPVFLALVQDHMPNNRALGNGLFIMISFIIRSLALVFLGLAGDVWGLRIAFYGSALLALVTVPAILLLPEPVFDDSEEMIK